VTRHVKVLAADDLLGLIIRYCSSRRHRRELIVLTLLPRYRRPLDQLPASRLLLPRSGLERSDFVPWHETDLPGPPDDVRS
jgi:hypothetical protein